MAATSIINYWPRWFRELVPGGLPLRTYCAVDIETSGFSPNNDVVTQWGHAFVEDGVVKDHLSVIFDWTSTMTINQSFLRNRLESCAKQMAAVGANQHVDYECMRKDGLAVKDAFSFVRKFVGQVLAGGIPFVLHGGFFDENFLSVNCRLYGFGPGFSFGPDGFYDTECIEKASQLISHEKMHPSRNDTLRTYFQRVRNHRISGVRSNLDAHCYEKYDFKGHGIKRKDMHSADVDAYCCHLVAQHQSAQITGEYLVPPCLATAVVAPKTADKARPQINASRVRKQRCS